MPVGPWATAVPTRVGSTRKKAAETRSMSCADRLLLACSSMTVIASGIEPGPRSRAWIAMLDVALNDLMREMDENRGKAGLPAAIAGVLDRLGPSERLAFLKLATGNLRIGLSGRLARTALAQMGEPTLDDIEEVWHGLKPPYPEVFAWVTGGPRPAILMDGSEAASVGLASAEASLGEARASEAAAALDRVEEGLNRASQAAGRIAWHPAPAVEDGPARRWVSVVFLEGAEADEVLELIDRDGTDAAIEHLAGHDYGAETTQAALENGYVYDEPPAGVLDKVATHDVYTLTYNPFLGHVSLLREHDTMRDPALLGVDGIGGDDAARLAGRIVGDGLDLADVGGICFCRHPSMLGDRRRPGAAREDSVVAGNLGAEVSGAV